MFAVDTYEEIEKRERETVDKHIVVLLFVRPNAPDAKSVVDEFDYIHYNSGKYYSIYAVGYSNDSDKTHNNEYKFATKTCGSDWYFSSKAFVRFKNNLEARVQWEYSGETEIIVLQSNPEGHTILNFQNYVAIDVNAGLRDGYIDSFQRFMESLIRSSKSEVTATSAIRKVANKRFSVKNVMLKAIDDCKKVPTPIKAIIKDRLFYRTCVKKR